MTQDDFSLRLAKLERRCRVLTAGLVAAIVTLLFVAAKEKERDTSEIFATKRLVITDAKGRARIMMLCEGDEASLMFLAPDEKTTRLQMVATKDVAKTTYFGENESQRIMQGLIKGAGMMVLASEEDKSRVALISNSDANGILIIGPKGDLVHSLNSNAK